MKSTTKYIIGPATKRYNVLFNMPTSKFPVATAHPSSPPTHSYTLPVCIISGRLPTLLDEIRGKYEGGSSVAPPAKPFATQTKPAVGGEPIVASAVAPSHSAAGVSPFGAGTAFASPQQPSFGSGGGGGGGGGSGSTFGQVTTG